MSTAAAAKLEERVLDLAREFAETDDEIDRSSELSAIEVDSLDLVEIGQIVEEEFGVTVQPEDIQGVETVGGIIDVLASRAS
jgi:acyl carrier protein